MGRRPSRERVIRELQAIVREEEKATNEQNLKRFSECQLLQQASRQLGNAIDRLNDRQSRHSAFTAATFTPMEAPPGWLPPPI